MLGYTATMDDIKKLGGAQLARQPSRNVPTFESDCGVCQKSLNSGGWGGALLKVGGRVTMIRKSKYYLAHSVRGGLAYR